MNKRTIEEKVKIALAPFWADIIRTNCPDFDPEQCRIGVSFKWEPPREGWARVFIRRPITPGQLNIPNEIEIDGGWAHNPDRKEWDNGKGTWDQYLFRKKWTGPTRKLGRNLSRIAKRILGEENFLRIQVGETEPLLFGRPSAEDILKGMAFNKKMDEFEVAVRTKKVERRRKHLLFFRSLPKWVAPYHQVLRDLNPEWYMVEISFAAQRLSFRYYRDTHGIARFFGAVSYHVDAKKIKGWADFHGQNAELEACPMHREIAGYLQQYKLEDWYGEVHNRAQRIVFAPERITPPLPIATAEFVDVPF